MKFISFIFCGLSFLFIQGSVSAQVNENDITTFLNDSAVRTGHAGISIYEPATGKYVYNYNADKNFIPASNVKLFSLYAGMKYLGDSLVGMRITEDENNIYVTPSGDPTLLHPRYKNQPVIDFLGASKKKIFYNPVPFFSNSYGEGWVWNDYQDDYMVERSAFPIYGNLNTFIFSGDGISIIPGRFAKDTMSYGVMKNLMGITNRAGRNFYSNNFYVTPGSGFKQNETVEVPFITSEELSFKLLSDTLRKEITENKDWNTANKQPGRIIFSRPVDSLFKQMMFVSDNFFAEQTLQMVSNERLGFMSDTQIIDTLLKDDLKDIPSKPRWVDGSGLSRYNLFTPKDFVYLLDKFQKEFGIERMKRILPTGGKGTLTGYYEKEAGYIFAKTGSMSNVVAISGYLFTRQNKMLLFSVIINNFRGSGREGRRAVEKLIQQVRNTN